MPLESVTCAPACRWPNKERLSWTRCSNRLRLLHSTAPSKSLSKNLRVAATRWSQLRLVEALTTGGFGCPAYAAIRFGLFWNPFLRWKICHCKRHSYEGKKYWQLYHQGPSVYNESPRETALNRNAFRNLIIESIWASQRRFPISSGRCWKKRWNTACWNGEKEQVESPVKLNEEHPSDAHRVALDCLHNQTLRLHSWKIRRLAESNRSVPSFAVCIHEYQTRHLDHYFPTYSGKL